MAQPILGSLEWMNYTMHSVHPVYSAAQTTTYTALTDENVVVLTDESGTILTDTPATTVVGLTLIRWM